MQNDEEPYYETDDNDDDNDDEGDGGRDGWHEDASVSGDPAAIERTWGHAVDFVIDAGVLEVREGGNLLFCFVLFWQEGFDCRAFYVSIFCVCFTSGWRVNNVLLRVCGLFGAYVEDRNTFVFGDSGCEPSSRIWWNS